MAEEDGDLEALKASEVPPDAQLRPGVVFIWQSFFWLSNRRARQPEPKPLPDGGIVYLMRPAPISFEAIDRFATRYGIVGTEFDRFLDIIDRLDAVYREILSEQ